MSPRQVDEQVGDRRAVGVSSPLTNTICKYVGRVAGEYLCLKNDPW